MRTVASYAFSYNSATPDARGAFQRSTAEIERWLDSKGQATLAGDIEAISYDDGRSATLQRHVEVAEGCELRTYDLQEEIAAGTFRTHITVAWQDDSLEVHCDLGVGGDSEVSPVRFEAHCPQVLRNLIDMNASHAGSSALRTTPIRLEGQSGGNDLIELIWSDSRSVPVVVISDQDGLVLHPGIAERMARDIAGLGLVARIDHQAAWQLTQEKGRDWSCYNGAIRLYWPIASTPDEGPRRHPLWTATRLLSKMGDTQSAADMIRNQIRRRILGQSAFAIREQRIASAIRVEVREHEAAARQAERERAREAGEWEELADDAATENVSLQNTIDAQQQDIRALQEEISDLKAQLRNAQLISQYLGEPEGIAPDEESPPATLDEAVGKARQLYSDVLVFGSDVDEGVAGLSDQAGPPDKVLYYLDQLAEMTRLRNTKKLGTTPNQWLSERNVAAASGESETIRTSPSEMRKRTWDDGQGKRRAFEQHLKPVDSTSPDLCVRVYHDYDPESEKTLVGWVGRHP